MQTTLLFKGHTIGPICRRIAQASEGKVVSLSDSAYNFPARIEGAVIRWDSRREVPSDLDINPARAVALSRNKKEARIAMKGLCPTTWTSWLKERKLFTYPCIVRAKRHYAAKGFAVANNLAEVEAALKRFGYQSWYISPWIKKTQEFRVFIFRGACLKVVRRFHEDPNAVAWNIANGGKSKRLTWESWPIEVVKVAIEAGKRVGLGWYAADVIVDAEGKPYVLELNTAPGLERENTIEMFAQVFASEKVPEINLATAQSYKDLRHPELTPEIAIKRAEKLERKRQKAAAQAVVEEIEAPVVVAPPVPVPPTPREIADGYLRSLKDYFDMGDYSAVIQTCEYGTRQRA